MLDLESYVNSAIRSQRRRVKERQTPKYIIGTGSLRGTKSLFRKPLPLPLVKGKGIKGMRLINKLDRKAE
jgi:hypothetical protein